RLLPLTRTRRRQDEARPVEADRVGDEAAVDRVERHLERRAELERLERESERPLRDRPVGRGQVQDEVARKGREVVVQEEALAPLLEAREKRPALSFEDAA